MSKDQIVGKSIHMIYSPTQFLKGTGMFVEKRYE